MRPIHKYEITSESYADQCAARRYNPALVLVYQGREYKLTAGAWDTIRIWSDGQYLMVLSYREALGYAGVQGFRKDTCEVEGEVFEENLCGRFFGKSDLNKVKALMRIMV